jgi:formate-nitrite transporter family protein
MSGRAPDEIWATAVDEGERRLRRSTGSLISTGFVGGADIMFGILALAATTGAFTPLLGEQPAHWLGSLLFGIGFVFLVVGRGELFTENFLIPVGAVLAGRNSWRSLVRLWGITFVANYIGIVLLALIMAKSGVLRPETLKAAGTSAATLTERGPLAAILSGVLAGAVLTLMTWLTHAAERDSARIMIAMLVGFIIAISTMNHAVVAFGEMILPYIAGTTPASLGRIAATLGWGVIGNLIGGLGLVTINRLVQARGEPRAAEDTDELVLVDRV